MKIVFNTISFDKFLRISISFAKLVEIHFVKLIEIYYLRILGVI